MDPTDDRLGPELDAAETERYGRHLALPEIGTDGQRRLKGGSVLCVGAGGLGSPVALYLAAAGVGRLGLVDFDRVDLSNLQRQVLYGTADVGRPKLEAARARVTDVNPNVRVELHAAPLGRDNALSILRDYDVVVDGTDNFATRYLVNDACVLLGRPNVYGSIFRFEGQASVFWPGRGPCYRCLYPEPPPPGLVPSCAEGGVLGVLPGIIGTIQATEAIKVLLDAGHSLAGRLLLFDALEMRFRELRLRRDPDCPLCGDHPTIRELQDYDALCAGPLRPEGPAGEGAISTSELGRRIAGGASLVLLDVRTAEERARGSLAGSIHIPVGEIEARAAELDRGSEIIVFCKSGARSARVVAYLRGAGFSRAASLTGGLDAWLREQARSGGG